MWHSRQLRLMRVTVSQIARQAGVSRQTAQYILAGQGELFRPKTREKVERVARELGYRPSAAARAMKRDRVGAIGMLLGMSASRSGFSFNMFWAIQEEMRRRDWHLIMGCVDDASLGEASTYPRLLREWAIDGLLISYTSGAPDRMAALLDQLRIPSVWLNAKRPHNCVYPDDLGGMRAATQMVLEEGHTRTLYVGFDGDHYSVVDRREGYESAVRAAGLRPHVTTAPETTTSEEWMAALRAIFKTSNRPTAVCCYDGLSEVIAGAALDCGLRVPRDLSICEALPGSTRIVTGRTIGGYLLDWGAVGHVGVQMLEERIESPGLSLPSRAIACPTEHAESIAPPPPR